MCLLLLLLHLAVVVLLLLELAVVLEKGMLMELEGFGGMELALVLLECHGGKTIVCVKVHGALERRKELLVRT